MKVLRDALIKEKQEKEILSKAKTALEKENERVKSQFQEKVLNSFDEYFTDVLSQGELFVEIERRSGRFTNEVTNCTEKE